MEWNRVRRKGFRNLVAKWDVFPGGRSKLGEGKGKFFSVFFSEIPDRIKAVDIFNLFGCIGDIEEVVIPPKRNKLGKRFGFARFKEGEDARLLAVKLDNVIIDGKKIHANLPRFNRSQEVARKGAGGPSGGGGRGENTRFEGTINRRVAGRDGRLETKTYAEMVATSNFKTHQHHEADSLCFEAKEEDMIRFKKAFVGVVHQSGMSYNIQNSFDLEGYFAIKVTPLGANLCLLEESEEGEIKNLISEGKSWWSQWFSEIREWKEKDVDKERVTWLRVYGIPCHAWSFSFFEMLANRFGSYVCSDENTLNGSNMDIARFMIRTSGTSVLNENLEVNINGIPYKIALREDSYGPLRLSLNQNAIKNKSNLFVSSSSESEEGFLYEEKGDNMEGSVDSFLGQSDKEEEKEMKTVLYPVKSTTDNQDQGKIFSEPSHREAEKAIGGSFDVAVKEAKRGKEGGKEPQTYEKG
ncbi:uncharacterized protein LOC131631862 [Vicia villosa]|uniref:uncharacterized protein LOC131631862 n=1 Tax=Vicia villosa TaxID=3911 RepID=UPI00273C6124|nr:uncharacterized protein LOC131631862 [Vicia villosa]